MEKYERDVKVNQLRKMADKGDYETAMKIADSLDWKKEKDVGLLALVSEVYEKNEEYQDAKEILLMAYERAPVGKRFLYKLTELALKDGDSDEAEAYYREFCEVAPDDPRQYLLRYMILRARDASTEQLIHALESYTSEELDERWLYELAELYSETGDIDKCVSVCDKIMLMFGLGKYVDKAMELKMQYAQLTPEQMDLFENREKYEQRLKAVEESFREEGYEDVDTSDDEDDYDYDDEDLRREAELEADAPPESPDELGKTRVMSQLKRKIPQTEPAAEPAGNASSADKDSKTDGTPQEGIAAKAETASQAAEAPAGDKPAKEKSEPSGPKENIMIEARTPEKGMDYALALLRRIQKETGVKTPVARITGSNLNKKGILENVEKLTGKTLLVEEAGDLSPASLKELGALLDQHVEGTRVLLIDNERQLDMMLEREPDLAAYFDRVTVEDVKMPEEPAQEEAAPPENEELDIDAFAQYACDYAASIDCSITGKSMLALYERIEIMEEDGIPLTRGNAESLIEEAADKAEKPGLVGSVKGIFSSKYNKDGLLILRESNFIS